MSEEAPSPTTEHGSQDDLRGSGTLLVVDDEDLIRTFTKSALAPYGYRVLQARDGAEAVRLVWERRGEIALILLDVAMPEMDGLQTLEKIREIRPDVPVMVCSGIGDKDIEARFDGQQIACFLSKPYTAKAKRPPVRDACRPTHVAGSAVTGAR